MRRGGAASSTSAVSGPPGRARDRPPPPGYLRKREATAALQAILTDARRGAVEQMRTGVTFALAAEDWIAYGVRERDWKPSTLLDNRSVVHAHLLPAFGTHRIENLRPARVEQWRNELVDERGLSRRTANKALIVLGAIFARACQAHGLTANPAREIKKLRDRYDHNQYDFYNREEIEALAQAAGFQQDAAIYRTATFTGLRMGEPIALRWSDIDFDSESPHVSPPTAPARSPRPSPGSRAPSRWPSRSPRPFRRCAQAVRAWRATISSSERVHRGVRRMTKSALTAALILTIGTTANAYPFLPRHLTVASTFGVGIPAITGYATVIALPAGRRAFELVLPTFPLVVTAVTGVLVALGMAWFALRLMWRTSDAASSRQA